ncbi:hypothetical protein FO519_010127, partial [Halicephalobus sp. NKZ332]
MVASLKLEKSERRRLPICLPCVSRNREPEIEKYDFPVDEEPYGGATEVGQQPEISVEVGPEVELSLPEPITMKVEEVTVPRISEDPEVEQQFSRELPELSENKPDTGDVFENFGVNVGVKSKKPKTSKKTYNIPAGYPEKSDPFTGDFEDLRRDEDPSRIQISELVSKVPDISLA